MLRPALGRGSSAFRVGPTRAAWAGGRKATTNSLPKQARHRPVPSCRWDAPPSPAWVALLAVTAGACAVARHLPLAWAHEAALWTLLSVAVAAPVAAMAWQCWCLKPSSAAMPLFFLGVFGCVCMDPLRYYFTGDRLHAPEGFAEPAAQTVAEVGLVVCAFCLAVVMGAWAVRPACQTAGPRWLRGPASPGEAITWSAVLLILGILPFVLLGEGPDPLRAILNTALAARSQTGYQQFETVGAGSENAALLVLINALVLAPLVAGYGLAVLRPRPISAAVLVGIAVCGMVLSASGGGRTRFAWAVLPLALFCVLWAVENRNRRYLRYALAAVLATTVIWIAQRQYRLAGWSAWADDPLDIRAGLQNDLAAELVVIIENFPHREPFYGGDTPLERAVRPLPELAALFLSNPIPRRLWPGKPIDPSWADYNELRTGADGLESTSNITATVMGRAYLNYGWFGVIEIGLALGVLCRLIDRWIERCRGEPFHLLLGSCAAYYLFISARELSPGWLYPLLFLAAAGLLAELFFRSARSGTSSVRPWAHRRPAA